MSLHRLIVIASSVGATFLSASTGVLGAPGGTPGAAPEQARMFGRGAPFAVSDLPPSTLRRDLESLPPQARAHALGWLHEFEFPGADADTLRADKDGAIFYVDAIAVPQTPQEAPQEATTASAETASASAAIDSPFTLHSRPGAWGTVYLDFTGHTLTKTAWNASAGVDPLVARPFDLDGSPLTVGAGESAAIAEIWHRVAEDYAPFDIDVTTEEPANFGPTVGRVLITSSTDANGKAMPSGTAGGVAYVGVWGMSNYASYYSPALVYYNNLANGTTYIAEAGAHEFGHNLSLAHDGTATVTYYAGQGSGYTSWAPIMGNSYYNNVTQWSKGEYTGANNTQDDIAIIGAKLGLLADDHGDTPAAASPLLVSASGLVAATNPQGDADNLYPENKGVIGRVGDKDVYWVKVDAGALTLQVNPAWDAFYRTDRRGANLDLRAVLTDAQGSVVAQSDPTTDTYASVSTTVAAGLYYLEVSAVGSANYSDYASQGRYFISGQVTPSTAVNQPPVAAFNSVCAGLACTFTDRSSDSDGSLVAWNWDFGDNSTATARQPTHSYTAAGTYSVRLTVTDNAGATAAAAGSVTPTAPANVAPSASFTVVCAGRACRFTDTSRDSDGSVQAWAWDFGNGTKSTLQNPSCTYAVKGKYTVKLTVTDNGSPNLSATAVKQINVLAR
ncbi:PKD domain-containing protein [uncultured Thiodictyon sp.]|jgi:PKD repeat protein|uniref:PKD domain-containing protein n=1 Tax=uncultured Thiodictyon sp. TaxID=1846217 RepID=UPI0025E7AD35|nr:PKD domain-containing protein [uncultured Thiodictyon sp.]